MLAPGRIFLLVSWHVRHMRHMGQKLLSPHALHLRGASTKVSDEIVDELKTNFEEFTGERIYNTSYWGHIHEKNMSTNTHNHKGSYVSAVVYAQTPENCGQIVFLPKLNPYEDSTYKTSYVAEKGTYLMFPSYLDHFVTRNNSNDVRISMSLNFDKL